MTYILLLAYLGAIFIRPHEIGDPFSTSIVVRSLIIATFVSYVVMHKDKRFSPQIKALIAFSAVIALSSILNGWAGGAITLLVSFLPAAFIPMLMCSQLVNTQAKQVWVMIVCLIAAAFMVHNGHAQHMHPEGFGWTGTKSVEGTRITYMGFFNDPNDLGMFLVMTLPFAFYFKSHGQSLLKLGSMVMIPAILYGIYMTNSRGSLLGVMCLLGMYYFLKHGAKKTMLIAGVIGPVAAVVMSKFRKIEQGESAQGRVDAWYAGFDMFFSNPLLGVGKGNFTEYNSHTAHNSFILVLGELGFLGYSLWFIILGLSFYGVYRVTRYGNDPTVKDSLSLEQTKEVALNRALLFSFVGFMATAFFLSRSYTILFFVFCGLSIASYNRAATVLPEVRINDFSSIISKLLKYSFLSVIGLYFVVRVLI